MSKLDPIDDFVQRQLASGRFADYQDLVRYALGKLKDHDADLESIAEEMRPGIEAMQRGEPGLIVDFEEIKRLGRKRLTLTAGSK